MTILEIILIGVIWVAYGVFSVYQDEDNPLPIVDADDLMVLVLGIVLSPLILVVRIFVGIFHKCTMNI